MRDHQLTIQTPEGVCFALALAGPISRFLAWLVDIACIFAGYQIINAAVSMLGMISLDISRAFSIVIFFILSIGYAIVLEWLWQGQTLGKRVIGLRVMDINGLRLQLNQVAIRNLLRAVDSLPLFYFLGGLVCLISRHTQRLGDLAANTIVIRESKVMEPDLDILIEKIHYNSLRDYPLVAARLRQQATPEEAELALQALIRRNDLDPLPRVALFAELAVHFKHKANLPREALYGVPDEQFVRNVVDVLFRDFARARP